MGCQEIRDCFSPWLDGELNTQEKAALEAHVASCPECTLALQQQQEISLALQALGKNSTFCPSAPAGFEQLILQQLSVQSELSSTPPNKKLFWFNRSFQRITASAAAVVLFLVGSITLIPRFFSSNPSTHLAENPSPIDLNFAAPDYSGQVETTTIIDESTQIPDSESNLLPPDVSADPGAENNSSARSANTPGTTPNTPGTVSPIVPESTSNGATANNYVAPQETKEQLRFLNKERNITSTYLRYQVDNLTDAQNFAQSAGRKAGATYKIFSGNNQSTIIRYAVSENNVANLINSLASVGILMDRQVEEQNITYRFADTMEQYRSLVAQVNQATDTQQRQQLIAQANALENQLNAWDQEAKEQILVLTLERKK